MKSSNVMIDFIGDGKTKEFNFSFDVFDERNLIIYINRKKIVDGYKINMGKDGGVVLFYEAPAKESYIRIVRRLPFKRTTDFKEGGPFRASRVNGEFDYQLACMEQIGEEISRSISIPISFEKDIQLTIPEPESGKALVWDTTGKKIVNSSLKIEEVLFDIDEINGLVETSKKVADRIINTENLINNSLKDIDNKASKSLDNLTEEGLALFDNKADLDLSNITKNIDYVEDYYPRTEEDFSSWDGVSQWERRSSGKLEQWGIYDSGMVRANFNAVINFPHPFDNIPIIVANDVRGDNSAGGSSVSIGGINNTAFFVSVWRVANPQGTRFVHWHAIGRG